MEGASRVLYLKNINLTILMHLLRVKVQSNIKLEVEFKTVSKNCLLIYTGDEKLNSYLIIGFSNGHIIYQFSLTDQKQVFTLKSPNKLSDNKWHTVTVEK